MAAIQYRPLERLNTISHKLMDTGSDEEVVSLPMNIYINNLLTMYIMIYEYLCAERELR